jgi:hypothetical protein
VKPLAELPSFSIAIFCFADASVTFRLRTRVQIKTLGGFEIAGFMKILGLSTQKKEAKTITENGIVGSRSELIDEGKRHLFNVDIEPTPIFQQI